MIISERIQTLIHKFEVGGGARWQNYLTMLLVVLALAVWYDTHCYHNFDSAEAMDAAQVGRNLAEGKGFTTEYIRPFDVYLLQRHNGTKTGAGPDAKDPARLNGRHPDLANGPLYPLLLAGLFKLEITDWSVERSKTFWSDGGHFLRYKPEFLVAIFNQLLLLVVIGLTFVVARTILDVSAAWLAGLLMLGSDCLWKFSVSGLPTLLLMAIFLGLVWCLTKFEIETRAENPGSRRLFNLALAAGLLAGLGMLTRYSFGWVIGPVVIFILLFGGTRRAGLAAGAALVFALTVAPWIARNLAVSGTLFGTAGYAVTLGTTVFPGNRLLQMLSPDMSLAFWLRPYLIKLVVNGRPILEDDLLRLGGGWMSVLFMAGLLLGLRTPAARRMRYFTLLCLGVFIIVTALLQPEWTPLTQATGTGNLLTLLTPLVIIFGVAFFLTLLNQMATASVEIRYGVVGLVVGLACLPFIMTLLPPKTKTTVFPPYYPPDIQRFCAWINPDELMMSDIPWAVAWYGDRQCTMTTVNCQSDFFQFEDEVKHISALYLTTQTLDARLFSECLQGGVNSWSTFVFERMAVQKIQAGDDTLYRSYFRTDYRFDLTGNVRWESAFGHNPERTFPLQTAPSNMSSGLFLTDRQRWKSE
jgi:hypothetical protein